ncbi:DnaB-like helicase N-terminal domain-containing protein [Micromonospora sp. WMMD1120]|uniref:DnaB-like helicase N-terminal domain-containing protein n=1 Tax=Micromonospora sp. WMMD1120 TaxID=3016106 RepID=UPI002416A5B6|nr:DnaB-like helicase N-terminal domain-containing protein [Micromonospora sp. WMMD1120]MDG4809931.1 DnaB-like helicase N-terminal domain-containing protein [Micromonospora sp. WMMD1120]
MTATLTEPTSANTDPVVEAERFVIGTALTEIDHTPGADELTATDFYLGRHGIIWRAITAARAAGEPTDPVAIGDRLGPGDLKRIGGLNYLAECSGAAMGPGTVPHHAGIIRTAARRRRRERLVIEAAQIAGNDELWERRAPALLQELAGQPDEAANAPRRSWKPVDLTAVLAGEYQPPLPTVGRRGDGVGMFYPGRLHTIASESEAGKTWLALLAVRAELEAGNAVVYLDFEDDEGGVVGRLMAMQVKPALIRDRFAYFKPDEAIGSLGNREDLAQALGDLRPTLSVLDGVTEAMSLHGLEMKDNTDIAAFGKMLPRWIADRGPASVALDHVTKSAEGRGRYAIGGVHKLNGLNGAAYTLENRRPFGVGLTGRSTVQITKDRPAQLRRHSLPGREGLFWFGDLVMTSHEAEFVELTLDAPVASPDTGLRPTAVMLKVSRIVADNPGGLSKNAIENMAGGKAAMVRTALELLVNEGYVLQSKVGAALVHSHIKPFVIEALEAPDE